MSSASTASVDEITSAFENLLAEVSTPPPPSSRIIRTAPSPKAALPTPQARADRKNPFYEASLTLGQAATRIRDILYGALLFARHLNTLSSLARLNVLQKQRDNAPIKRMFLDLRYVEQFLRVGRKGWDLRTLPEVFFRDVLPIVGELEEQLEKVGKSAEMVRKKGLRVIRDVGGYLDRLRGERLQLADKKDVMGKEKDMELEQNVAAEDDDGEEEEQTDYGEVEENYCY